MFSGSDYLIRLLQRLSDVWSYRESKMALSNFLFTNDIVYLQLVHALGGLRNCLAV